MNTLYPLKFRPVFKDKIWGGNKIKTSLGLDFSPLPNCGEAWVLSGVEGSETLVSNGFLEGNTINELLEVYMDDLAGEKVFDRYGEEFPLLIKFIDSNDYLSIQVHPDDTLAAKRKLGNGKSEMWYVIQADENASLYSGFSKPVDQKTYLDYLKNDNLTEILNVEKVSAGDVFHIPAGRIHALGPGILLAEIQQSSDTTYRIHDWNRKDDKGNSRELHTEEALEAIDFNYYPDIRSNFVNRLNKTSPVVNDPHFNVNHLEFDQAILKDYSMFDSFVILLCVDGSFSVRSETEPVSVNRGECVLIPAMLEQVSLYPEGKCKVLEVFV